MKHVPEHEQLRGRDDSSRYSPDALPNEIRDNRRERSGLSSGVFASCRRDSIGNLRQGQLPLKPP
jgi:hypothetical protein